MLLGRLRIRGKLALLVVIPLISTVGLAVPVVIDRVAAAQRAGDIAERVRLASRIGTLVQDLQQERILSVGLLLGRVSRTELVRKSATVDDRVADLRAEQGDALPAPVADALDGVRSLTDLRRAVLAGTATPSQIMDAYGPVDLALIESLRLPFSVDTETAAGRQGLALDALLRADEGLGACATLIVLVKASNDPTTNAAFVACMSALTVDNRRFRRLITPEQLKLAVLNDAAVAARTSADFLTTSVIDPSGAVRNVTLDALFPSARSMITLGQFIEKKIVADVLAEVTGEQRRALTAAYLVGGLAALILAVVLLLSVAVARTVARPLTRLTRSADRVARLAEAELVRVVDDDAENVPPVRLDPVDVRARDEIGDLARAFDRVQATAAGLVERQVAGRRNVAQMFGHVGRRTQNLVGRQLALIDRLERQETDPARLEHLYRLDHISSRLRRNAGSLVVLSGSTGADAHVAPVPLGDVVRLALGEIEDYTRVDVRVPPGVSAAPGTVGDLVLALAELMENATAFSPPHTRVVVTGELIGAGARLAVVDQGIGMTAERLAEENTRLTRRERLDLAPTEVLGLFVVGRLARRHGWAVRLTPTIGGGVTVLLDVPLAALVVPPTERAGATVARATVPARERRLPPRVVDATGGRALAAAVAGRPAAAPSPAADAPAGFDPGLLGRATRSLESGESWDAFGAGGPPGESGQFAGEVAGGSDRFGAGDVAAAPAGATAFLEISAPDGFGVAGRPPADLAPTGSPAGPAPTGASAGPAVTGSPASLAPTGPPAGLAPTGPVAPGEPGTTPAGLPRRARRNPPPPDATGAPASTVAPDGPDGPARPGVGIRQRVPGASLPPAAAPTRPVDATGTDPAAARALLESFESGVRRAELTLPAGVPGPVEPARPAGPPHHVGPADHPGTPAGPALNRRVPGANLTTSPAQQPVSHHPGDPAEVRDLITAFEAGVARALHEVRPDRPDEEGTSR
ncbi:Signal transduction histidine kinase [Micromonospora echinaurantiaca]|uniref:histidine kinase n=1 Tax=Micromonospora echinaurantiaca TaxID=47857 RepID=A0A1C5K3T3_9ACTN|nr:sensor histidine kinase [Micromonospora echinaurantiaca]SCG77241.1 Signal transduction histidine kinase [Micromonospora echinaurantiaca]